MNKFHGAMALCLAGPLLASAANAQTPIDAPSVAAASPAAASPLSAEGGASAPTDAPSPPPEAASPLPAQTPTGPVIAYAGRSGRIPFVMTQASTAAFGMIGAFAGIAQGKDTAENLKLNEPSEAMAANLAAKLAEVKGGRVAEAALVFDTASKAPLKTPGAQYVVHVGPTEAGMIYFPFDWTHYTVNYTSSFRVADAADGKILLKARCVIIGKKAPDSPSYSEMMADEGARLKSMLKAGEESCLAQFHEKLAALAG